MLLGKNTLFTVYRISEDRTFELENVASGNAYVPKPDNAPLDLNTGFVEVSSGEMFRSFPGGLLVLRYRVDTKSPDTLKVRSLFRKKLAEFKERNYSIRKIDKQLKAEIKEDARTEVLETTSWRSKTFDVWIFKNNLYTDLSGKGTLNFLEAFDDTLCVRVPLFNSTQLRHILDEEDRWTCGKSIKLVTESKVVTFKGKFVENHAYQSLLSSGALVDAVTFDSNSLSYSFSAVALKRAYRLQSSMPEEGAEQDDKIHQRIRKFEDVSSMLCHWNSIFVIREQAAAKLEQSDD